ncbi:hypothetical protein [Halobacillus seohaensis]|uniref:Rod shape-determining protein MreD n=1 Tax=Halobacillus seohaensis TaxID=447421 RepID=A0ABW2EIG0_9BACI
MMLWEAFDKNEISILIMNVIAYIILLFLLHKFRRDITVLILIIGFSIGVIYDFTIGGGLMDFYKLNDSNRYEVFDLIYYLLFAPFIYFFLYLYEALKINKVTFIWYVLAWALFGVLMQWFLTVVEVIEYQKGYKLTFSFSVFLVTQTVTGLYYEFIKSRVEVLKSK